MKAKRPSVKKRSSAKKPPRAAKGVTGSEATFLEAIYAAPDEDAPRLVYADWLQENGDPWGELIILQISEARGKITPAATKRIAALLKKHAAARFAGLPIEWASRDQGVVTPVKIARGFPVEAFFSLDVMEGAANGDPRWGTFERLHFGPRSGVLATVSPDAVVDPAKRAMRALGGLTWELAVHAAKGRSPRLRELGAHVGSTIMAEFLDELARLGAGQWLETLHLDVTGDDGSAVVRATLATPLGAALPRIVIDTGPWDPGGRWRVTREHTKAGVRVTVAAVGQLEASGITHLGATAREAAKGKEPVEWDTKRAPVAVADKLTRRKASASPTKKERVVLFQDRGEISQTWIAELDGTRWIARSKRRPGRATREQAHELGSEEKARADFEKAIASKKREGYHVAPSTAEAAALVWKRAGLAVDDAKGVVRVTRVQPPASKVEPVQDRRREGDVIEGASHGNLKRDVNTVEELALVVASVPKGKTLNLFYKRGSSSGNRYFEI